MMQWKDHEPRALVIVTIVCENPLVAELYTFIRNTKVNEISVCVRFQFKFPARCSDSSDIREGWTNKKTTEFEWRYSCHLQPTTSSIFATWCAARRLNTPCPWVSRQRSYLSSPNNGCFGNAMIPASVRTLHEAYVQEIHHRPSAMVAVTSKLKPKRPKRR